MCRIGDIYTAELDADIEGSLQSGIRPVLIISNNKANEFSPVVTIIPITSRLGKKKLPTHVYMTQCGLSRPSIALAEQITSINKSKLIKKVGSIKKTIYEQQIKNAIGVQLNLKEEVRWY